MVPFDWTPQSQAAFDQMKALLVHDVLFAYSNHDLPFHVYTGASNYQLSTAIFQQDKPIDFTPTN